MSETILKKDPLKAELFEDFNYVKTNKYSKLSALSIVIDLVSHKDKLFSGIAHREYDEMDLIQNIILNKKVIIDFCFKHPEAAYDVLYWPIMYKTLSPKDFKGYSKEQIATLPRLCREVIVHPENLYKIKVQHKIDDRIIYFIPENKPFEALEWIAKHAPDKLKSIMTKTSSISPFGRRNVVAYYSEVEDKSKIPAAILEYIEGDKKLHQLQVENGKRQSESQKQARLEKKLSWTDENGELIKLFELSDKMPITSVEDYLFIANYFMQSDLSVSEFCRRFQIENVQGFKEMCEKVSLINPEFETFYNENLEKKSKAYVAIIKHQIEDVADGKLKVVEMLTDHSQMKSLETVMSIGLSTVDKPHILKFAEQVINYYYDRIHSYDAISTDESELLKRLTEQEVRFLMSAKVVKRRKNGSLVNLGDEFTRPFVIISNQIPLEARDKIFNRQTGLYKRLDGYSTDFDYNSYLNGESQFIMPNGYVIQPTSEMIDMADAYASTHNLFKSGGTMSRILKSIIEGKIQNQAETEEYKQKLQALALKKMKECKDLTEYFAKYNELSSL